jgi:integrase
LYWCFAVSEGIEQNADGSSRRRRKVLYFDNATAAIAARSAYLAEAGKPTPADSDVDPTTVAEFINLFLAAWKKKPSERGKMRAPNTLDSYKITLDLHVKPYIGDVPIVAVTSDTVRALYRRLEAKVSQSMLARVHAVTRLLFAYAIEERVIAVNPLAGIPRSGVPRHTAPHVVSFEPSEIAKLLKAAEPFRLGEIVQLAVDSGARQGELFALRWQDVDLETGTVYIKRNLSESSAGLQFCDTKTHGSRRNVTVTLQTIAELKRRRAAAEREGLDSRNHLIFCSESGDPLWKSNFRRDVWGPIRKGAGLPNARFHSLRHTCATLLLRAGVHPKIVQERLGHKSIALTLDTYSDSIPSLQEHAAAAMSKALSALSTT